MHAGHASINQVLFARKVRNLLADREARTAQAERKQVHAITAHVVRIWWEHFIQPVPHHATPHAAQTQWTIPAAFLVRQLKSEVKGLLDINVCKRRTRTRQ